MSSTRRTQRDTLRRFERALGRETHQLALAPLDLWQQLYNRLRWQTPADGEFERLLERELSRRLERPPRPWLRARTRRRESENLLATLPFPEGRGVETCAISPDGRLALAASDYWLAVFDLTARALLTHVRTGVSVPEQIVISPDGETAALVTPGAVQLYDVVAGTLTTVLSYEFLDELHGLKAATFRGDRLMALTENRREITLLEAQTGEIVGRLHDAPCWSCAFSQDGRLLLTAAAVLPRDIGSGAGAELSLWDADRLVRLGAFSGQRSTITACAFSPDSALAASGEAEGTVMIRRLSDGKLVSMCEGHTQSISACVFSADARMLVTAAADNTLGVWNVAAGTRTQTLAGHAGQVTTCALHPDGHTLLSGSKDGTLKLWDISVSDVARPADAHAAGVTACRFTPDGRHLLSAGRDRTLRVWDTHEGSSAAVLAGHRYPVVDCALSPDGRLAVSASEDATLCLWEIGSGLRRSVLQGHEGAVTGCAFSPLGDRIVSSSTDSTLRLWRTADGTCERVLRGHDYAVNACAFSPDGQTIASVSNDHTARLWRAADGDLIGTLEGGSRPLGHCAFSPDGAVLAAAGIDNRVRLWTLPTGEPYATLAGHRWASDHYGIFYCHFSPDGRRLLTGAFDGTLRIWDVAGAGQAGEFADPGPPEHYPTCAAWSPDGSMIAAGFDTRLHLVAAPTCTLLLTYTCAGSVSAVAFDPAADMLAVGDTGGAVSLLDLVGFPHDILTMS